VTVSDPPLVSIVVGLISGRPADLDRCLAALRGQRNVPPLEILVPFDEPCREVAALGARYPEVQFVLLEGVDTRRAREGGSREHHDLLRTLGIRRARGRFIVLTEDHAYAHPDWCASLLDVLGRRAEAAGAGGAIEWEAGTNLSYAVYLCDFGRYQNPLPEGPARFVSDSNVCYRRDALEAIAGQWTGPYQEAVVHGALTASGRQIWLTPHAVVWQGRSGLTWREALRERFVWGESFAAVRIADAPAVRRAILAVLTPALPFVLTWRLLAGARRRRRDLARVRRVLPHLFALSAAWSLGEFAGYVLGQRSPRIRAGRLAA
jgi:hypothetical protein